MWHSPSLSLDEFHRIYVLKKNQYSSKFDKKQQLLKLWSNCILKTNLKCQYLQWEAVFLLPQFFYWQYKQILCLCFDTVSSFSPLLLYCITGSSQNLFYHRWGMRTGALGNPIITKELNSVQRSVVIQACFGMTGTVIIYMDGSAR